MAQTYRCYMVQSCHNMNGLFQGLAEPDRGEAPVLTMSRADEKDGEPAAHDRRRQAANKTGQMELFPAARDFK